jgi:hypothetical protein
MTKLSWEKASKVIRKYFLLYGNFGNHIALFVRSTVLSVLDKKDK